MHWISRTALELIAQGGLGYSMDPLTEDAVIHPYSTAVKELVYVTLLCPLESCRNHTLYAIGPCCFRQPMFGNIFFLLS
jgi:hypothetical protein